MDGLSELAETGREEQVKVEMVGLPNG